MRKTSEDFESSAVFRVGAGDICRGTSDGGDSPMMRWEQSLVGLALGLSLLTLGCGGGPKLIVTGEGTIDGKPLDGAQVVLEPEDINANIGAAATDKDGKFQITPRGIRNVLSAGDYVVTINKHVFREDNPKLKNMDPEIKKEILKMAKLGELPVGRGKERN